MLLTSTTSGIETPQVIPPSPQSQLFEKYVNHEISEYNGLPDITIPLYEIEIKGLKIPIALTYHASGIQYMQHDGEVGVGWSINAVGYRISRSIKGKSDLESNLYDENTFLSFLNGSDNRNIDRYLAAMNKRFGNSTYGRLDGEYDLFTYITPSTNGHFVLTNRNLTDHTYTATALEQKMDKILMNHYSGQLVDENGVRYDFGNENAATYSGAVEHTDLSESMGGEETAWALRTIRSPYGDSISFSYSPYGYVNTRDRKDSNSNYNKTKYASITVAPASTRIFSTNCPSLMHDIQDQWNVKVDQDDFRLLTTSPYLTRITSSKEEVEFIRVTRNGKLNSPNLINEIKVYDITSYGEKKLIKKITFTYANMSSNISVDTTTNAYPWHTVLTSVRIGDDADIEKEYTFDYYDPPKNSHGSPDYWNYYAFGRGKGSEQDLFLPDPIADISFTTHISGWNASSGTLGRDWRANNGRYFINRNADEQWFNAFSLKRITYPTGGYTEYEYELNQFNNPNPNGTKKGNGQRIRSIKSLAAADSDPIVTVFKYGKNESGLGISSDIVDNGSFAMSISSISVNKRQCPDFTIVFVGTRDEKDVITFFNTPVGLPNQLFAVYYPEIHTYQYNKDGAIYNGQAVSSYNIPNIISIEHFSPGLKPNLSSRIVYNTQGQVIQKEAYTYQQASGQTYMSIISTQKTSISGTTDNPQYIDDWLYTYNQVGQIFIPYHHNICSNVDLLTSKREILYTGTDSIVRIESYTYDSTRNQLTKITQHGSLGETIEKEFVYPDNNHQLISVWNMYATKLQEISRNNGQETKRIRYNYPYFTNRQPLPLPLSVDYSETGANGFTREYDYLYDQSNGNLTQYTGRDGIPISYLWGYGKQYPVLQATGATYQNLTNRFTSDELGYIATGSYTSEQLQTLLSKARIYYSSQQLPVHISSYSYIPLVGLCQEVGSDGLNVHYRYDTFGRLLKLLDHNKNVVKQYQYHYTNQDDLSNAE
ncbi:MAG: hypothetical protein LBG19_08595 [Prevotellaceae bacterium]|jgi:hypothetical protein|nr:hypothetical protein [Prevotellaceae bacterium]